MNTKIENCNTELLEQQKDELRHEIIYGTNKDAFKIFDIEAGCRKTRTAEEALAEMVKLTDKNAILVRLNDNDCRESAKNINRIAEKEIAFAYNNEDVFWKDRNKVQKRFSKIRVLILTHQKYRALALDPGQRKKFIENRTVLVIDEFISNIKKITLSPSDINTYKILFKYDNILYETFLKSVYQLEDTLRRYNTGRKYTKVDDYAPMKNFSELRKLIKANITSDFLKKHIAEIILSSSQDIINVSLLSELKTVNQLCDKMECIEEFYKHICITDNGTFYTTDRRINNWLLENNILLDASGELQIAYNLNNHMYKLMHYEKVLDHSEWNLINIKVNTTSAAKENMLSFYDVINNQVKKYDGDILVIGSKSELQYINLPEKNKGYFGNITGSNKWADKSHVAIIQTHNLNDIDYILTYLYYSNDYINELVKLSSHNSGRRSLRQFAFDDKNFEKVRNYWIASETYQAIKRVNRNMSKSTDALVFMNNDSVMELIKEQLRGCKAETLIIDEIKFNYINTKQDEYIKELQDNSYANKFIDLMVYLQSKTHPDLSIDEKNRITKKEVREHLGINTSGNFSNKVLSKTSVVSFCKIRGISIAGKYITFMAS
ncbi:MAG: hypothetical protein WBI07_13455 [Mobilitalea sp.]